jgi:hypothetical protein
MPHSPHVRKLLRRVAGGVYARLMAISRSCREVGPATFAPLPEFEGRSVISVMMKPVIISG